MLREIEPTKFRQGESTGKPLGGNVSPEPFPQALASLAQSRGYESQRAFALALGKKNNGVVKNWYKGERVPSADELGLILRLFEPNDEELDTLLEPYRKLLQEGKGRAGGLVAGSESARTSGLKKMRPAETPVEEWIKEFCKERKLTLKEVLALLGIRPGYNVYGTWGVRTYSKILQNAQAALGLTDEEVDFLGDAVAQTIQHAIEKGHKFTGGNPYGFSLKKAQSEFACTTYNGQEAGDKLGISRERVRQFRKELGLPILMTEGHLEVLRERRQRKPSV